VGYPIPAREEMNIMTTASKLACLCICDGDRTAECSVA